MTVKISKPALNLREELNKLDKPSGITGETLLRADTDADARATLGIDNFEQVSVSTDGVISADGLTTTSSVGIGTSSPSQALHVVGSGFTTGRFSSTNTVSRITFDNSTQTNESHTSVGAIGSDLQFRTNNAERMRIDSSGNVGIGTSNPAYQLEIGDGTDASETLNLKSTNTGSTNIFFSDAASNGQGRLTYTHSDNVLKIYTADAERMRIDSSGNLLVGGTTAFANDTTTINSSGLVYASRSGNKAGHFNRQDSDGAIIELSKNGTGVGSIGVDYGNRLYIGTGNTGLFFNNTSSAIQPIDTASNLRDDAVDLGSAGTRFKNLYLSGGVYLGGTGAANKLDDYEEGSWTLVITGESGGSVSTGTGYYKKTGNFVYCAAYINQSMDLTSLSGLVNFSLPFTGNNWHGGGSVVYGNSFFSGTSEADTFIGTRTLGARARLLKGSSTSWITVSDIETASGSKAFMFEHSYQI